MNQFEMPDHPRYMKQLMLALFMLFYLSPDSFATVMQDTVTKGQVTSTREQALAFLDKIKDLEKSTHWPNIKPRLFLKNLRTNIEEPINIYPGKGTNFCGYGALTYLFLQDDPLGYAQLLLDLYQHGIATFRKTVLTPRQSSKPKQAN
ncbi:MAG: hypothetical protein IPG38_12645 [Chitinophagaceae bacterium]|nr:hypothetical protein [Chitinophagaceae bacterium]